MVEQRSRILDALPPMPAVAAVALMVLWAYHDGGYDADTWCWGALVLLSLLTGVSTGLWPRRLRLSRPMRLAIGTFGLYVAWSYLSIAWASSPGDALEGSNRALLYLFVFALFAVLPWTAGAALVTLVAFVLGIAAAGASILVRLAQGTHALAMFSGGRLVATTGYFNSSAALFALTALLAIALAVRKELPSLLRGAMLAIACGCLQLALLAQSRGWLFTLPLVALVSVVVVRDRIRVACAALLPIAATLALLHRLLGVFRGFATTEDPRQAFVHAGRAGVLVCGATLIVGTLLAMADNRVRVRPLSAKMRRAAAAAAVALALLAAGAGAVAATHGHPVRFVSRQWSGFTNLHNTSDSGSHFSQIGSGRYDFWRVALDAFLAHPIGGLGQDNFADFYVRRRHTIEEPQWTHSLEMRLLAHTGIGGLLLFTGFLAAAIAAATRARRRGGLAGALAAAGLLPLVVWLIHGSVDWFWEIPALSAPALGFLAMAGALGENQTDESLGESQTDESTRASSRRQIPRAVTVGAALVGLAASVVILGFSYLSVREVSTASEIRAKNPSAALRDLTDAAKLNPLSSEPGRLGGAIALQAGQFAEAEQRFGQAVSREPGGWFSWLGAGLAASALGDAARAHHDFAIAASINTRQPAVTQALQRVYSRHPLTPSQAFGQLVLAP
jgi:hypothetical protein